MASKILVAALLASGSLGRTLRSERGASNIEAREFPVARGVLDHPEPVKRSPQDVDNDDEGFSFDDYETQEDFWAEWDTLEAFLEEHANQFTSEDDFWQQLEAALPTEGGSGEAFSFADYEDQEDFWAEWDTIEAFFEEYPDLFESEDQFWEEFEAALPAGESSGGGEDDVGEIPEVPELPDEDEGGEEGGEFPGSGGGEIIFPDPEEDPEEQPDPIIVVGPIE